MRDSRVVRPAQLELGFAIELDRASRSDDAIEKIIWLLTGSNELNE